MIRLRVPFLALPLFLAWHKDAWRVHRRELEYPVLRSDESRRLRALGRRALEAEGYTNVQPLQNDLYGVKGQHGAIVVCSAPPTVTIVIATSAASADALASRRRCRPLPARSRLHERIAALAV